MKTGLWCNICKKEISKPKNGLLKLNEVKPGSLIRMHHRHKHSDYSEQVQVGFEYYKKKGFNTILATRMALKDAREKWERDYGNYVKSIRGKTK